MIPLFGALVFGVLAAVAHYRLSSERLKMWLLVLVGVSVRAYVALQSPLILQDWPLNDDSHYYFTIARNFANGGGMRHDSEHITTGFQPLFMFVIAPLFRFIEDRLLAINAVLLLQTGIGVACALLLHRLACLITTRALALLVVAIWATSPTLLGIDLNGLETNTSLCVFLATLCVYFRDFVLGAAPSWTAFARIGFMCGLCFLARVDLGLLIPVLSADILLREFRRQRAGVLVANIVVLNACAVLTMAPWLIVNRIIVGSVLPSSGQAVRFLSQAYGYREIDGPADTYFEIGRPPVDYYLLTAKKAVRDLAAVVHGVFPLWAALPLLGYAIAASTGRLLQKQKKLLFLYGFLGILFLAYISYVFGQWFFRRYLVPIAVGYLLFLLTASEEVAIRVREKFPAARRVLAGVAVTAIAASLFASLKQVQSIVRENHRSGYYQVVSWVNQNTPKDSFIGAFQTGILGYYLERRFCGLDGKINVLSLRAMQDKSIDVYTQREKIDYLMDWPWVLDVLFTRRAQDPNFLEHQKLIWHGPYDVYQLNGQSVRGRP